MQVDPKHTRIGWIGTGVMGGPMCGHLMSAGFAATVHSRTPTKLEPLLRRRANAARTPREVAEASDVVFTCVGYPAEVRHVVLATDGVLAGSRPGQVIVDMTTSEPSLAIEIADKAHALGVISLDAPVSGGDVGAREAKLSIMVGGDREATESLAPCWNAMGRSVTHMGAPGAGQHTKMVNQILIASNMVGVCEALIYGHRAGLSLPEVLQAVSGGAAASWSLSNLAPRMLARNYDPGFFVEHFRKDMGVALAEARRMKLALPGLALAEQLYAALAAQGHERSGTQALVLALSSLSNVDWNVRQH